MKKTFIAALITCATIQSAFASGSTKIDATYVTSDFAQTKYPIVFAPGAFGFDRIGTNAFGLDYWYQILPNLARNGGNVWTTSPSPLETSEVRGEQTLLQVEDILAITGKSKVNLLGHSHGAQTVRYVAGVIPSKIASVTTVAGVNKGSPMADVLYENLNGTLLGTGITTLVDTLTKLIVVNGSNSAPNTPVTSWNSVIALSTKGANAFNQKFPMGIPKSACGEGNYIENGVRFYSFSGNTVNTNIFDPTDWLVTATGIFVNKAGSHDGLVPTCSSHLGQVIRTDYRWNHFDEVNQVLGLMSLFSQDPVAVYRQHANRLKLQGL